MNSLIEHISADFGVSPENINLHQAETGASSKRYFRISGLPSDFFSQPVILLQAPKDALIDYEGISAFFCKCGIRSPQIFHRNLDHGFMIVEDCGNATLEKLIRIEDRTGIIRHYKDVLNLLLSIQVLNPDTATLVGSRFFDREKYNYEFRFHFCQKLILEYFGYILNFSEHSVFDQLNDIITDALMHQPTVFVHRDFQSSNLLLHNNEWIITDYQDARMGPALYDVVSLVEDAYVRIPQDLKLYLIDYYREIAASNGIPLPTDPDFRFIYDVITIQRKLHDAGAFVFSYQNFGNSKYLPYINGVVSQALDVMSRYSEFAQSHELLNAISHDRITKE